MLKGPHSGGEFVERMGSAVFVDPSHNPEPILAFQYVGIELEIGTVQPPSDPL